MKFLLKLLADWTDQDGNEFKAGAIIETEDKDLASTLMFDGKAELAKPEQKGADKDLDIGGTVKAAVADALKDADIGGLKQKAVHLLGIHLLA